MAFSLPNPMNVIQNALSPVDISLSLESLDFGTRMTGVMVATATFKAIGEPIPYLPLDLLLNGQLLKRITLDSTGKISVPFTLTQEGTYTFEAVPSYLESFQNIFGPFVPSGTTTLTVYSLTFKAFNAGLGQDMNVGIGVNGKGFTTPTQILSPSSLHLNVTYPQITQGVYSLDSNQFDFDVNGDEAFLVRYNAPSSILGSLSFTDSFGETIAGQISGEVRDIGGNPFPNVPLSINGNGTQTDANGNFSMGVHATSPGIQSLIVTTLTPISVNKTFQFPVYSLTFKAFNSGLRQDMNVGITAGGKSFTTPITVLAIPLHFSASYPQITQSVYPLDAYEFDFDVSKDTSFLVHYNAPGAINAAISFIENCIKAGATVAGQIVGEVRDVGGNLFPKVPLSIGSATTQTDSYGKFSMGIQATSPGTQSLTVKTLTPVPISQTFQQDLAACLPPTAPAVSCAPTGGSGVAPDGILTLPDGTYLATQGALAALGITTPNQPSWPGQYAFTRLSPPGTEQPSTFIAVVNGATAGNYYAWFHPEQYPAQSTYICAIGPLQSLIATQGNPWKLFWAP